MTVDGKIGRCLLGTYQTRSGAEIADIVADSATPVPLLSQ